MIERRYSNMVEDRRALFSECGAYRYLLEIRARHLSDRALLPFIGLNPSSATERSDDPTMRRERRYALDMGYGGVLKANLAALRATSPAELVLSGDPLGPENTLEFLRRELRGAHGQPELPVVACWGAYGAHPALIQRAADVVELFGERLLAFGFTRNGHPLHPLYLRAEERPRPLRALRELLPGDGPRRGGINP